MTETSRPVSVSWIWSISIPSGRARRAASFIILFLDGSCQTEHLSSSQVIYHRMSNSPPLSPSIPKSGHEPKSARRGIYASESQTYACSTAPTVIAPNHQHCSWLAECWNLWPRLRSTGSLSPYHRHFDAIARLKRCETRDCWREIRQLLCTPFPGGFMSQF